MSFYQGKRGVTIRALWMSGPEGKQHLRDWLIKNELPNLSLTIFTYLAHYEPVRAKYLQEHGAEKPKKAARRRTAKPKVGVPAK